MAYTRSAEEAIDLARRNLPFDALFQQLTSTEASKRMTCPFCQTKNKFGLFTKGDRRLFKCFKSGCAANIVGDEIGFIALWLNLDRKEAFKDYLKRAGVSDS